MLCRQQIELKNWKKQFKLVFLTFYIFIMKNEKTTPIKLAEDYVTKFFKNHQIANPENLSRLVISDVVGMPYSKALIKKPMLTQLECDTIDPICDKIALGEPVQYVLGHAPFRFLDLEVNRDVLIPRPETEMMVDIVAYYLKEHNVSNPLIADVGTGSGCLAISCATEIENSHIYATDISACALKVAKRNAKKCGVEDKIDFEQCECLDNFDYFQHATNQFSAIISNPPYVPDDEMTSLPIEVRMYEPREALKGGKDGLDVFKKILVQARTLIEDEGIILFELHETTLGKAKEFAEKAGLNKVTIMKDLVGKDRFLACVG